MNLEDFPMDRQRCPLRLGSFGYTTADVVYQWTAGRGVNIASDMKLSQFDLISSPTGNETTHLNHGSHSTLLVSFHLQRHMGDFVIQVYGPCILLVVISWVSFWLNREATSDRISLGITTVLTMTFLGLEARKDLPKVTYPTALDYFVFISFAYIFSTVVQFGLVHHFTKLGSGEYYLEELEHEVCPRRQRRLGQGGRRGGETPSTLVRRSSQWPASSLPNSIQTSLQSRDVSLGSCSQGALYITTQKLGRSSTLGDSLSPSLVETANFLNHHPFSRSLPRTRNGGFNGFKCSLSSVMGLDEEEDEGEDEGEGEEEEEQCRCKRCITRAMNDPEEPLNSVSKIDRLSRVIFPLSYITINIFYWNIYLDRPEYQDLFVED